MKKFLALLLVMLMACASMTITLAEGEYTMYAPPIVETPKGMLRGLIDDGIINFRGVQYATAERFCAPQPVEAWEGVIDAQTYGFVCPIEHMTAVGSDELYWPHRYWVESENCQNLNIWTPDIAPEQLKPVIVFLHGGAFSNGSSIESYAYDGRNLAEFGDLVVVTINHRLNVIGTLNLDGYGDKYATAGNTGMMDVEAALRWVNENISCFGGDPSNVTIFGQSGGSGKVVTMMCIPTAEGLFHKGIAESSGTASFIEYEDSLRITEILMENLHLTADTVSELETMDFYELLHAADEARVQAGKELGKNISWRPVRDGEYICLDFCDFAADIPFIAGTCFSERNSTLARGDGRKNEWTDEEIHANLKALYGEDSEAIQAEFARLFPNKKIQDAYFYAPSYRVNVRRALDNKAKNTVAPVYNYLFAYEAPVNGGITPFHCAELIYVFHNVDLKEVQIATGDCAESYAMQDVVAQAWVNFCYTGNPSQEGLEWLPYNAETRTGTMVFDVVSEFIDLDDENMVNLMN